MPKGNVDIFNRENIEIMGYIDEIRQIFDKDPEAEEFVIAVENLENYMPQVMKQDRRGSYPLIDKGQKLLLSAYLKEIGQKATSLIGNLSGKTGSELKIAKADELRKLASANLNVLNAYDENKEPKPLPFILEDARPVTVDLRDGDAEKLEADDNRDKYFLRYVDDKGKIVMGTFMPEDRLDSNEMIRDTMETFLEERMDHDDPMIEDINSGKEMIRNLFDNMIKMDGKEYSRNFYPNAVAFRIARMMDEKSGKGVILSQLVNTLKHIYPDKLSSDKCFEKYGLTNDNLSGLAETLTTIHDSLFKCHRLSCINDQARLDNRSAAVRSVADLMGLSRVVANARPIRVIDMDGNTVEGTFTVLHKGMTIENPSEDEEKLPNGESLTNLDGRAFRDLADIQVLDYICGNMDRGVNSLSFRLDKDNKLASVRAVDNDICFSIREEKDGWLGNRPGAENLVLISRSTCEKVRELDPEELKLILRSYELSEAEINKAGERLKKLQKCLVQEELKQNTHTRIVRDEDFSKIRVQDVYDSRESYGGKKSLLSSFISAFKTFTSFIRGALFNGKSFLSQEDLQKIKPLGTKNRANEGNLEEAMKTTRDLADELEKTREPVRQEYDDLLMEVRKYHEYQSRVYARILNARDKGKAAFDTLAKGGKCEDFQFIFDGVIRHDQVEQMRQYSERIAQKAEAAKAALTGIIHTSTEDRQRIAVCEKAFRLGSEGRVISEEERSLLQKNDERSLDSLNRLVARGIDKKAEEIKAAKEEKGRDIMLGQ